MRTRLLLTLTFVLSLFSLKATHYMGADLTYECLNGCTYRIYSSIYYDCDGAATTPLPGPPPTPANTFSFTGTPSGCQPSNNVAWTLVSYTEVTPLCPSAVTNGTQCTNPNAPINGVLGAVYYTDINLCNSTCTQVCFQWTSCCRNNVITSLNNPGSVGIFSGPVCIDLTLTPCNSSPVFSNVPTPYICAGQPYTFNQGATDPDGDSLSYALGPCYDGNATAQVPYNTGAGFSPTAPLGPSWTVNVNPVTGDVSFLPNPGNIAVGVMCIVVTEWRNGVQIGQITRDMQITVITGNCSSNPQQPPITDLSVGGVPTDTLTATSALGCVNVPLCFNLPIDTTGAGGVTYTMYWNNGIANGIFSDANNPATLDTIVSQAPVANFCFTPTSTGAYSFVVTVKDDHCPIPGSVQFTIVLYVSQGMLNTTATANYNNCNEVIFTAYPDPNSLNPTYLWTGNGNLNVNPNATDSTFTHLYPSPGLYPWQVVIQDTFGCKNTITGNINIPTGANADAGSDISMCSGFQFQLGAAPIPGQTYSWSPGTGLSSTTASNPMISMVNPGPGPIQVDYTLTATLGLCTTVDYVKAIVYPTPTVDITPNNPNICVGDSITLTASGGTNYLWSTGATSSTITVAPSANTTYSVVSFVNGCSSLPTFETVNVTYGPVGQISGTMGICTGTNTTLTASGGSTYVWNNGLSNASITLTNLQNDTTVYMIPSNGGCPGDTIFATVLAYSNPTANFTATTACAGTPTVFTDLSVIPSGNIISWAWNFGDPTSVDNVSSLQSPNHVYAQSGTYNVSLAVTSANGCVHTFTAPITVTAVPNVNFTFSDVCEGATAIFTNQTNIANGGTISSYAWDFGDASGGTQIQEAHTYSTFGQFNVTLSAVSNNGCTDSYTKTIIIHPKPDANFTSTAVCRVENMPFISTATVEGNLDYIINPDWNFGDPASAGNNIASGYNPYHNFTTYGTFNVTQIVTTNHGCKDTIILPVTVYPQPIANFALTNRCENQVAQFGDISTVDGPTPITAWYWNFGVGNVASNDQNPVFDYEAKGAGTYSVTMIVSTTEGCKDTLVRDIAINPIANVDFTSTQPCLGDSMHFTNTTTISSGSINETNGYVWTFEETPPITMGVKNPVFLYNAANGHYVTLTAISDSGCVNSLRKVVRVNSLPEMPAIHQDSVCVGDKAVLSVDPANVDVVRWYTSPNAAEPFYTGSSYISPELSGNITYYVQLTTAAGCKSAFYPVTGTVHLPEDVLMTQSATLVEMPSQVVSFGTQSTIPLVDWTWNFGDENSSFSPTPSHEYNAPGRYTVKLTTKDENGCIFYLTSNVEVKRVVTISVPTAFSPNNDGSNDEFYVGTYNFANFYIGVYNRWGTLVYESNDPAFRWDGKDKNGKVIPEGVYVYVIKATTFDGVKEDRTGTITVTR